MLQSGDTLAGYRIEAVAGVGGMGVVYRATQLSLDRPVALKVLSSTLVGNRTFRERFRREGRHAAALDHPNIIPVYEAGESNGLMFIAMRLVDGPSLADLVDANRISGREALRVLGAIASALDAAHEGGLVHRDIKPQNILLTRGGHPYLADFGITKGGNHGGLTHSGDFVGSLNYVAPEQIRGEDVTGASDIYSLTALLFHCLSGVFPYQRETDAALMLAHLEAPPPSLRDIGIASPPLLDRVFARGMAKRPQDRYATATALLDSCGEAVAPADSHVLDGAPAFPAPSVPAGEPPAGQAEPDEAPAAGPEVAPRPPAEPVGGATRTDRQLGAPSSDPATPPGARRVSTATLATAAVLLIVAAPVAGFVLGEDDPPPKPATERSAALTLVHDATWSRSESAIEGLELAQPITLRRADGLKLSAGRMPEFRSGFDPVPSDLSRRFLKQSKSPAVPIRLGTRTAVRHAVTLANRERLWLALLPDSKGWIAVACEGPGADLPAGCPSVASSIELEEASAVPLGPDKRVATQINDALAKLNSARKGTKAALRSRKASTRASGAERSAAAHEQAASVLSKLSLRPQERPLVDRLADELAGQASNLERLAAAAARRRVAKYDSARAAIGKRERHVQRALRRLRSIGYRAG